MADSSSVTPITKPNNKYLHNPNYALPELCNAAFGLGGAKMDAPFLIERLVPGNIEAARAMVRRLGDLKSEVFFCSETLSKLGWIASQNDEVRREIADDAYSINMSLHYLTRLASSVDDLQHELAYALATAKVHPFHEE